MILIFGGTRSRVHNQADFHQGKSLSLICAALTWLRSHKRKAYEISIDNAANLFKDEPEWVVEQLLKRKRAEIVDLWEEREANLRDIRAKEALMEQREKKRRRYDEGAVGREARDNDDIEEEWLLDEEDDEDVPKFSNLGKEELSETGEGDQVKVGPEAPRTHPVLTNEITDILHIKDTFTIDAVHLGATPADISIVSAGRVPQEC